MEAQMIWGVCKVSFVVGNVIYIVILIYRHFALDSRFDDIEHWNEATA